MRGHHAQVFTEPGSVSHSGMWAQPCPPELHVSEGAQQLTQAAPGWGLNTCSGRVFLLPSIASLHTLCAALGIPLADLEGKCVGSSNSYKWRHVYTLTYIFCSVKPCAHSHIGTGLFSPDACIRSLSDPSHLCRLVNDLRRIRTGNVGSPGII